MKKNLLFILFVAVFCISSFGQVSLPYSQNFEGTTFPPTGWQLFAGASGGWVRDTNASGYGVGTACTSFDNFNTSAGSYYGIRLPNMNFTSVAHPYIRFDIAYAQRSASVTDIFGLWWSNNGTSGWANLVNYSSTNLNTAPLSPNLFIPTPTQWQTKTFSLSSLAGLPFVRLAIEDDCAHGNVVYFDNVTVFDSLFAGIEENNFSKNISVSPIPFNDEINITSQKFPVTKVELYNSTGSLVELKELHANKFSFDHLSYLPEGIYMIRIYNYENVITRRMIKI